MSAIYDAFKKQGEMGYKKGYEDARVKYEPKWTKVEDGLPEDGEKVIILVAHPYMTNLIYVAIYDEMRGRFYKSGTEDYPKCDVVAWMPIPKYEE